MLIQVNLATIFENVKKFEFVIWLKLVGGPLVVNSSEDAACWSACCKEGNFRNQGRTKQCGAVSQTIHQNG